MSATTSSVLAQDSLSRKSLAFCGYTGYAAIILFIIGGVWLGGMLPPIPNANDAPAELVAKVNDNLLNFRIGSIFMIASFALFGTFGAGMAAQTRRFETSPVFSYVQIVFAAAGTTIALLVAFAWSLMVFRPDTYEPSILLMWADFAYFLALFSVPGREPFPRWVAYVNLWAALLFAPGQMVIFFKDGPFSWHGIVAMYLPFIAFFAWIAVMSWVMIKIAHDENS